MAFITRKHDYFEIEEKKKRKRMKRKDSERNETYRKERTVLYF